MKSAWGIARLLAAVLLCVGFARPVRADGGGLARPVGRMPGVIDGAVAHWQRMTPQDSLARAEVRWKQVTAEVPEQGLSRCVAADAPGNRLEQVGKTLPVGDAFVGFSACLVIKELSTGRVAWNDADECRRRTVPCSTFKIPNTLIALETGVVGDIDQRFHWDGTKQPFPAWEQDHDVRSALAASVVWVYQGIARAVGTKRMQRWLDRLEYGDRDISAGLDRFWLGGGSLGISPLEQVTFLARLARHTLPVSRRATSRLLEAMPRFGDVLGKTGTAGPEEGGGIGWFVGLVRKSDGREFAFALRLRGDGASGATARKLALDLLARPNIIAPEPAPDADGGTTRRPSGD